MDQVGHSLAIAPLIGQLATVLGLDAFAELFQGRGVHLPGVSQAQAGTNRAPAVLWTCSGSSAASETPGRPPLWRPIRKRATAGLQSHSMVDPLNLAGSLP
jgi:hypothetical protein